MLIIDVTEFIPPARYLLGSASGRIHLIRFPPAWSFSTKILNQILGRLFLYCRIFSEISGRVNPFWMHFSTDMTSARTGCPKILRWTDWFFFFKKTFFCHVRRCGPTFRSSKKHFDFIFSIIRRKVCSVQAIGWHCL